MPIEKAFAIRAKPHEIYRALERDLAGSAEHEGSTFEVLHRNPGRSISLRVTISGIPCRLTYTIVPRDEDPSVPAYSEVVATLDPYGWKYQAFRIMTLGLSNGGFDAALVQGLANLKESVEQESTAEDSAAGDEVFPDEAERMVTAPDE